VWVNRLKIRLLNEILNQKLIIIYWFISNMRLFIKIYADDLKSASSTNPFIIKGDD
jgi:hypothetical protein